MKKVLIPFTILLFIACDFILLLWVILKRSNVQVLNPQGLIAHQQLGVMITVVSIMLLIVTPVLALILFVAVKYRAGNVRAVYEPEGKHGKLLEISWWLIPTAIVLLLAVVIWKSTHALDPAKSLNSSAKPVTIQVIALRWKWLFIYPEQNIATVNFIQFPQQTPIKFELTADGPMNSFWIPSLGGQIYSMTGMGTKLHLMADKPGDYSGLAAEINGKGFSEMTFVARASTQEDFEAWVEKIRKTPSDLSLAEYEKLAIPSENTQVMFYSQVKKGLYNEIIMKFMEPNMQSMSNKH